VWSVAVVVTGIGAEDAFEVPFIHDQEVIEALRSHGANESLGKCVRIRSSKGGLQDLGAFGLEHFVEACHVLGVTITDQELGRDFRIGKVTADVSGLLNDPCRVWMSGYTGDPDSPAAELDEEQHIETFEHHRVDMEKVRRYDTRCLGTQELTSGRAMSSRSGAEAVVFHDVGNGARRNPYSELDQFTLDAPVAPSRVLSCQAYDERFRLVVDGRSTW
jgi:hypothetical protein